MILSLKYLSKKKCAVIWEVDTIIIYIDSNYASSKLQYHEFIGWATLITCKMNATLQANDVTNIAY